MDEIDVRMLGKKHLEVLDESMDNHYFAADDRCVSNLYFGRYHVITITFSNIVILRTAL